MDETAKKTKKSPKNTKKKPTLKQRNAALKMVENGGNVSKAMRDAGYSPKTAKVPSKLTESLGFQTAQEELRSLMDKYLPQDVVFREHASLVTADPGKAKGMAGAKAKAIGMAHELRGNFPSKKIELKNNLADLSDEELESLAKQLEEQKRRHEEALLKTPPKKRVQ